MIYIHITEITSTPARETTVRYKVEEPNGRVTYFNDKEHALLVKDAIYGARAFEERTTIITD